MPTHDPARKRQGFRMKRKPRIGRPPAKVHAEQLADDAVLLETDPAERLSTGINLSLKEIAPLMWKSDYTPLIADERRRLSEVGMMQMAAATKMAAPPSTYTQRGLNRNKTVRMEAEMSQATDIAATAVRQANQQNHQISICARSVWMLMRRSRSSDWTAQSRSRQVLSKPTTIKLVRLMMLCRPRALFHEMPGFALHIYDQRHTKKGAARGTHRAAEKVDASGDLVDLVSMTIVNSLTIHVPAALASGLSPQLLASLKETGPYTKPLAASLLPRVHPERVKASLYELMSETGTWLHQVKTRSGNSTLGSMTVALVARACVGRPAIDGGKAFMDINPPILNCDTKSHSDGIRIFTMLESLAQDPDGVLAAICDGQSMIGCVLAASASRPASTSILLLILPSNLGISLVTSAARLKRRDPERWKMILILCGCFHQFGHFLFGGHESFFEAIAGYFARLLHKTKVPKLIKNFEGDTYKHVLTFDLELAIGIMQFLTIDVTSPAPELLTSQPVLYDAQLQSAGAKVVFKWLLMVGNPALHWLRAGRQGDGSKVEKLHPISFHMYRATTHKVNCVLISLLGLLSTCATPDPIAEIVRACVSFSWTGRVGSLVYGDRLVEQFNLWQSWRDGKYAAFEKALQYTPDMAAMIHVAQVWDCFQNGDHESHDPVTQSILNGAAVVRAELKKKLGTDLTVKTTHNPFWHTGNPVNLANGSTRINRPWEFIWHVADGTAAGKGRVTVESYAEYIERTMANSLFPGGDDD